MVTSPDNDGVEAKPCSYEDPAIPLSAHGALEADPHEINFSTEEVGMQPVVAG